MNACAFVTGEDNVSDPLKYAAETGHYLIAYNARLRYRASPGPDAERLGKEKK